MTDTKKFLEDSKAVASKITKQPIAFKDVNVDFFKSGNLLEDYAKTEFSAVSASVELGGGKLNFTEDDFVKYCRTCVFNRIAWVNKGKYIFHPNDRQAIPAMLSVIMANIGIVCDPASGLNVIPSLPNFTEGKEILGKIQFLKISNELFSIRGYQCADCYLKSKQGCFDFMVMQLVDDMIQSHLTESHPVYALMAAVVGLHQITSAVNPLVRYGSINTMRNLLWEVVSIG